MLVTEVCWEVTAMLRVSMVFLCLPDQWTDMYLNRGQITSSLHQWIIIHTTATVSSNDLPIHLIFFCVYMPLNYFDNCKAGKFMKAFLSWRVKFSCWYPQHKLHAGNDSKMHRFSTVGLHQFLCSKWCHLLYGMQSCTFAGFTGLSTAEQAVSSVTIQKHSYECVLFMLYIVQVCNTD